MHNKTRDEHAIRAANSVFLPKEQAELGFEHIIIAALVLFIGFCYIAC